MPTSLLLAIATAGKVLRLTRAMRDPSLHWFLDRQGLIARRAGQAVVTFVIGESAPWTAAIVPSSPSASSAAAPVLGRASAARRRGKRGILRSFGK